MVAAPRRRHNVGNWYNGWNEPSIDGGGIWINTPLTNIVADDWICTNGRPVTDIHWWVHSSTGLALVCRLNRPSPTAWPSGRMSRSAPTIPSVTRYRSLEYIASTRIRISR